MTAGEADARDEPPRKGHADEEEMPRVVITRERALIFGFFVLTAVAFLYFVLPQIAGLSDTWHRLRDGNPLWLAVALLLETCAFACYGVLFRTVVVRGMPRIDWKATFQITLAGLAATRLFAAAGAGGVALTAWALRRAGMERRLVACRMIAFLVLLYSVYMASLVIFGLGLYAGIFNGDAPFAITVVPAILGALMIAIFVATALLPADVERRLNRWAGGSGRLARMVARAVTIPASMSGGVRTAIALVRQRDIGLLGVLQWYFEIATLWACFHAFGADPPPLAVIAMAYFVGMLANTLPLPGGIGGVDGGMIGAFVALDVQFGYAAVAVLSYRAFSFWLPTLPGAVAYFQLRRTVAGWREGEQPDHRPEAATAPSSA
jgi:uncharacterized protein (TIRG00374 family)